MGEPHLTLKCTWVSCILAAGNCKIYYSSLKEGLSDVWILGLMIWCKKVMRVLSNY